MGQLFVKICASLNHSRQSSYLLLASVRDKKLKVFRGVKVGLKGVYENGQERKDKLGASYAKIQHKVNELYRKGLVR